MKDVLSTITIYDIIGCAAAAFICAVLIRYLPFVIRLKKDRAQLINHVDLARLMEKCYMLFPQDSLLFNGVTFKRGMYLRITTVGKKIIEGRFIGSNSENVLCILTEKTISAEILENIEGITVLESE